MWIREERHLICRNKNISKVPGNEIRLPNCSDKVWIVQILCCKASDHLTCSFRKYKPFDATEIFFFTKHQYKKKTIFFVFSLFIA